MEKKWQGRGLPLSDRQAKNFERGKERNLQYITGVSDQGYPFAPSPNFRSADRGKGDILGVVLHSTEGWDSGVRTLVDPNRGASAHYGIERDGSIIQMVNEKDIAWHGGSRANNWTIGIEIAGFAKRPEGFSNAGKIQVGSSFEEDIGFSDAQIQSAAKLIADISKRYDFPIDKQHIFGHAHTGSCQGSPVAQPSDPNLDETAGGATCHYDPGDFEYDEFVSLVKRYRYGSPAIKIGIVGAILIGGYFLVRSK